MLPTILPVTIKSTNDLTYNISDLVFKQRQFPNSLLTNCSIEKGHRVYCPTWFSAAFRASSHIVIQSSTCYYESSCQTWQPGWVPHTTGTPSSGSGLIWVQVADSEPSWAPSDSASVGVAGRLRILLPEIHFLFLAMSRSTKRLLLTPPVSILAHWPHLGPTNTPPTHHHHHYAFMHP